MTGCCCDDLAKDDARLDCCVLKIIVSAMVLWTNNWNMASGCKPTMIGKNRKRRQS